MLKAFGLAACLSIGLLAGCDMFDKNDSGAKKDSMSGTSSVDRSMDKVVMTGAHGAVATYTWDKSSGKPMASLTGGAKACPMCAKAAADYYATGKTIDSCPGCGGKQTIVKAGPKGAHGNM